ncbi:MAG: DNA gyrase subunit A [Eubacteriales bacterium]|nr:DNA gyrase subunit A [Eubacteriales bacterium]
MEANTYDKIKDVDLKETMENSYIDYAMSVIVSRALPDVKDGLKPVQRRILYAAMKMGATADKKTKKCATIVGETMGHYHPHGDSSIYGALVNLGQPWSTKYPLIEKQGNFGSEDGDPPAAARYTEGKLSKISMEMLDSINKNTVDFVPNFSNEQGYDEPVVLPARIPNILVNGTTGIAVGMATNMPPHNLRETINAAVLMINNKINEDRDTELEELMKIVKGPDFPTGATILGRQGIEDAYRTGRGKIRMRAVCEIETMPNGKSAIIVKELPYMVFRSRVIENIADLHKEKKIDGITAINDTMGKNSDSKIRIELRKDVNPQVVLNQLYKHTQLQETFGVINLVIVDGEPKVLNLKQLLTEYLKHQEDIVTRRTKFDLKKAEDRAHILEGLLKAIDNIDEVIAIIRAADDAESAKAKLIERFAFTEVQAQSIVDMRLRALTGLERKRVEEEYADLEKKIARFKEILGDKNILLTVVRDEIQLIADKYGDERKTQLVRDENEINMEDLISDDRMIITMSKLGYIKRMDEDNFRAQNRGGKGIKGANNIENDYIEDMFVVTNHQYIMFFTNKGQVYRLKAYEIPEASRTSRGTNIANLLMLQPEEKITATIAIKEYREDAFIVMATKSGMIKKTPLSDFANVRRNGLRAIVLKEDDQLIEVKFTDGNEEIFLITAHGMLIRFNESDIRVTGRASMGVIGMRLSDNDEVIAMQIGSQGEMLLTVSEFGMGKRTNVSEFRAQSRGGKGLICYKISDKTGNIVAAKLVNDGTDILIITDQGQMMRTGVEGISVIGRNTSGVKLMNVNRDKNESIVSIAKAVRNDDDELSEEEVTNESEDTAASEDDITE